MTEQGKNSKEKMEEAIAVGQDITKVLDLDPPINTVFESNARGAQLTKARDNFTESVAAEIVDVAGAKDGDQHIIVPGDIPTLSAGTQEYLKGILPDESRERLFSSIKEAPPKKVVVKKNNNRYTRSNALVDAFKEGDATKKELIERAHRLWMNSGGNDKPKVAEALLRYVMPSLLLLGVVEEMEGKYLLKS